MEAKEKNELGILFEISEYTPKRVKNKKRGKVERLSLNSKTIRII